MAQTGCPQHRHRRSGKKLKAEFNKEPHRRGTVSMARAQNPDSGDSQFFICFADAPFLNGQYTVWGQVTEGMENVDKIERGEPVQNPIASSRRRWRRTLGSSRYWKRDALDSPPWRGCGRVGLAHPGLLGEPLMVDATHRAIDAPEEDRRGAEARDRRRSLLRCRALSPGISP